MAVNEGRLTVPRGEALADEGARNAGETGGDFVSEDPHCSGRGDGSSVTRQSLLRTKPRRRSRGVEREKSDGCVAH